MAAQLASLNREQFHGFRESFVALNQPFNSFIDRHAIDFYYGGSRTPSVSGMISTG
jgi:hypothetical protein